ncbi:MAG: group 1 truncated hemoglobin [Proteobacteria bacterium]|nr:group 1 truncated hemoglobin [Pseudomonadota bacterium]
MNIFNEIGQDRLAKIVRSFYEKSFEDPILAHFFWNSDHEHLLGMQLAFVTGMLGGPLKYRGKSLEKAHEGLTIRPPHFKRRQMLLKEAMEAEGLSAQLIAAWLAHEEKLRPLIMNDDRTCLQDPKQNKPS